jgi:hypothetical protein
VLAAAGIPPIQGCYDSDCGSPFADLDMWQGPWLRAAWNLQIVKGVGPGRFAPNRGMSRAEAAVIVANAFKIPPFQGCYTANCGAGHPDNFFLDITEKWQGPYVRALYDKGLVTGPFPNKFEPNRPINRAELTKLILKGKELAK